MGTPAQVPGAAQTPAPATQGAEGTRPAAGPEPQPQLAKRRLSDQIAWMRYMAWSELAAGLLLSAFAFHYMSAQAAREARTNFIDQCEKIEHIIAIRLSSYADILLGLRGFMRHATTVTRAEFRDYVSELDLPRNHPGLTSLNYATEVESGGKHAFVQGVRRDTSIAADGYPGFAILPPGERASYHVMAYVEPAGVAELQMGADLKTYSPSSGVLYAMLRDTGGVAAGPRTIPGPEKYQWGLRLATYRIGLPTGTPEERRAALTGSVGLRFSLESLLHSVLPPAVAARTRVRLHAFSKQPGPNPVYVPAQANLLIDSGPLPPAAKAAWAGLGSGDLLNSQAHLNYGGRVLGLYFEGRAGDYSTGFERALPYIVMALGLFSTLLLFARIRALLGVRRKLEHAVRERTQELKRGNERLLAERDARIRLERTTLKIAETERARLASELHDDLGQTLTASACLAQTLAQDLRDKRVEGAEGSEQADAIERLLSGAIEKTRLLAQGLMPLASQVGSIWVALELLAQHAREIFRIDCRVVCDPAQILEDRNVAQQLYRIAQEGVLNAVRHGEASVVTIEFSVSETDSSMRMLIIDNGGGINAERMQERTGVGLRIMRQRCRSIGLDMELEANPDGGTILRIE